jgi:uncharacterized repeat protein (TIGR03803 family)
MKPHAALMLMVLGLGLPCGRAAVSLTTLYSFSGSDGANPVGGLVRGSDANFYSVTQYGGAGYTGANSTGTGTVFRITHPGTLTNLYRFGGGDDGAWPQAGLAPGSDGNFYGSTAYQGANGWGTVFRVAPSGLFSTVTALDSSSGAAQSVLVAGMDGTLYTMGVFCNTSGLGTVLSVTPGGAVSVLWSFDGASGFTGWYADTLVQGADGNFYGATQLGGPEFTGIFGNGGQGTAFVMTPDGTLTTLVSFDGTNGYAPTALVQAADGDLYGVTGQGGPGFRGSGGGYGTIFKLSTNGTLTTLALFNRTNGSTPTSLIQASDGNFYGTTYDGGTSGGYGTVFKMTADGTLTSLLSFNRTNGANPYYAPLLQDSDGSFYGTTYSGGASNRGTIFRLTLTPLAPQLSIIPAAGNVILSWPTNAIGFTLQSATNLGPSAIWTTNFPAPVVVNGQNAVTNPISGTQQFFRLSKASLALEERTAH